MYPRDPNNKVGTIINVLVTLAREIGITLQIAMEMSYLLVHYMFQYIFSNPNAQRVLVAVWLYYLTRLVNCFQT